MNPKSKKESKMTRCWHHRSGSDQFQNCPFGQHHQECVNSIQIHCLVNIRTECDTWSVFHDQCMGNIHNHCERSEGFKAFAKVWPQKQASHLFSIVQSCHFNTLGRRDGAIQGFIGSLEEGKILRCNCGGTWPWYGFLFMHQGHPILLFQTNPIFAMSNSKD